MASLLRSQKELLGCSAEQIRTHASILHYPTLKNGTLPIFFPEIYLMLSI